MTDVAGGKLTTHVLDTASGKPAAGLVAQLLKEIEPGVFESLRTVVTNADGRVDGAVLGPLEMVAGVYELRFAAGDYLRRTGAPVTDPAFLDVIPIRFGISDTTAHYHVPLLLSPYGYSTYRGS